MQQTIKGITRSYRKSLRAIGRRDFPKFGPFHVRDEAKQIVKPSDVGNLNAVYYSSGPAPLVSWKPAVNIADESHGTATLNTVSRRIVLDLPALGIEPVFRRVVSDGICNGKPRTRTNYRPLKNPKAGSMVWVKREVSGKLKWVEVAYDDLLAAVTLGEAV